MQLWSKARSALEFLFSAAMLSMNFCILLMCKSSVRMFDLEGRFPRKPGSCIFLPQTDSSDPVFIGPIPTFAYFFLSTSCPFFDFFDDFC